MQHDRVQVLSHAYPKISASLPCSMACSRLLWDDPTRAEQVLVVARVSGMRSVMQVAIQKMRTHSYYNNRDGRIQLRDAEKELDRTRGVAQRHEANGFRQNGNGQH